MWAKYNDSKKMLTGSLVFLPPRHHSKLEFEVEGEC